MTPRSKFLAALAIGGTLFAGAAFAENPTGGDHRMMGSGGSSPRRLFHRWDLVSAAGAGGFGTGLASLPRRPQLSAGSVAFGTRMNLGNRLNLVEKRHSRFYPPMIPRRTPRSRNRKSSDARRLRMGLPARPDRRGA